MYVIKQKPEDFIVEEIPKINLKKQGEYSYFLLEKTNWNTIDIIKKISKITRINQKYFNYAGIKDKQATTKQIISIKGASEKLENLKIKNAKLTYLGKNKERIKLGQLLGNHFIITIRNIEKKEIKKLMHLENYYDSQRFGGRNHILGKALIKKEFRKAVFSLRLKFEKGDYVGALRKIDKRILRLYINAYQSYLWNKATAEYIKQNSKKTKQIEEKFGTLIFTEDKIKNINIPIIGYLTEINPEIKKIYNKILKQEKITTKDFIIKQMPELSSEGNQRKLFSKVENFKIQYSKDKLHKNKQKAIVEFTLEKGAYATMLIKKLFS